MFIRFVLCLGNTFIVDKFGGKVDWFIWRLIFVKLNSNISKPFITDIKSLEIIVKIGLNGSFVKLIQNLPEPCMNAELEKPAKPSLATFWSKTKPGLRDCHHHSIHLPWKDLFLGSQELISKFTWISELATDN